MIGFSSGTNFSPQLLAFVDELEKGTKVILVLTGKGNSLADLDKIKCPIIWCKNDDSEGASIATQLVFGGMAASNHLDNNYSLPEAVSVNIFLYASFIIQKLEVCFVFISLSKTNMKNIGIKEALSFFQ